MGDEIGDFGITYCHRFGDRVLRCNCHVSNAGHGIGAGCIYPDGIGFPVIGNIEIGVTTASEFELELYAFRTTNPVFLLQAHGLRPAFQLVSLFQQFVSILSDLQEPLRYLASFDLRARTPTASVGINLFVSQHGLFDGVPVNNGHFFVGKAFFYQLSEEPLLPFVILGCAGCQFARPVIGESELLKLLSHLFNIGVRPFGRCSAVFDGSILRWQPKRIPTHWLQDIEALHSFVTRNYVPDGVVPDVTHVQTATGIRKHAQAVVFGERGIFGGSKGVIPLPKRLNIGLGLAKIVLVLHVKPSSRVVTGNKPPNIQDTVLNVAPSLPL